MLTESRADSCHQGGVLSGKADQCCRSYDMAAKKAVLGRSIGSNDCEALQAGEGQPVSALKYRVCQAAGAVEPHWTNRYFDRPALENQATPYHSVFIT